MTVEERIRHRNVGIIGMARSGIAAALLANRFDGKPYVSDSGTRDKLAEPIGRLDTAGIPYETGGHTERLLESDYLVVSPGVPLTIDILKQAKAKGLNFIITHEPTFYNHLDKTEQYGKDPVVAAKIWS